MNRRLARPVAIVVTPIILIGLAASVIALSDRLADPGFAVHQRQLSPVRSASLAHLLSLARDPSPGLGRPRATSVVCSPRGSGELRNPWSCVVRYGRAGSVAYQATISGTGRVQATDASGQLVITGCCARPGASQ